MRGDHYNGRGDDQMSEQRHFHSQVEEESSMIGEGEGQGDD